MKGWRASLALLTRPGLLENRERHQRRQLREGHSPATVGERVGRGVTLLIKVNLAAGTSEKHASTVDVRGEPP